MTRRTSWTSRPSGSIRTASGTGGLARETSWEFRSAKQADDKAVPLSLLQVGYTVPTDLTGRVAARPQPIGFTVDQQAGAPAANRPTLQASVSFDEGKTWRRVTAVGALGHYVALVPAGRPVAPSRSR